MSITQEMVTGAEQLMTDLQADIYFRKLASLGIVPTTDEQSANLWELGDAILKERPRLSDQGLALKQASLDQFGTLGSRLANDGCSEDAHKIAEKLCQDERIVKAAHILLAVNNAG